MRHTLYASQHLQDAHRKVQSVIKALDINAEHLKAGFDAATSILPQWCGLQSAVTNIANHAKKEKSLKSLSSIFPLTWQNSPQIPMDSKAFPIAFPSQWTIATGNFCVYAPNPDAVPKPLWVFHASSVASHPCDWQPLHRCVAQCFCLHITLKECLLKKKPCRQTLFKKRN